MTLDPKAMAYAAGSLCGGGALLIGLVNLSSAEYGREVLELLDAVFPGYHVDRTIESVFILTGYALVTGAALGWVLARVYNRAAK